MISEPEIIARLLLGALFGGLVGFERQVHGRPAGFRTHLLVCTALVLLMVISEYYHHLSVMDPAYIRVDPGRIAAGAITGVGFIGAGVIIKTGATVNGLTTAASLWMVSAIGMALGAGLYLAASVAFGITLFSLIILGVAEKRIASVVFKSLSITGGMGLTENTLRSAMASLGIKVHNIDYETDTRAEEKTYRLALAIKPQDSQDELNASLLKIEGVRKIVLRA